ncbi:MAG: BREX-1 system phosphatase PglZ type B [Planctomycetota bacterium]
MPASSPRHKACGSTWPATRPRSLRARARASARSPSLHWQCLCDRLEAEDFNRLLGRDPVRDLLRGPAARERMGDNGWGAFVSQTRERLGFDPSRDPDVRAGELLGRGGGPWEEVWQRFVESPTAFPGIETLLRRSRPSELLALERERWPDVNEAAEADARAALDGLAARDHATACQIVVDLERVHAPRRSWVWARLGQSPLAAVLEPLARLAGAACQAIGGTTPAEIAQVYRERGWQADAAGWEAVGLAPSAEEGRVSAVVRHLLLPWLAQSAETFQVAVEKHGLPRVGEQERVDAGEDDCVLFSDGLRYDLGVRLAERLEGRGLRVNLAHRFALLPTVTATAKPAVSPVADLIRGEALQEDFGAVLLPAGKPANAKNLREAMRERGYQILGDGELDTPQWAEAKGWLEFGDIDDMGHKVGARLARSLGEELDRHCERIAGLLDSGWKRVRVVTDHGWLLLPGGLPKVDLPKHLTASRWARCAVISGNATPDVLRHPWSWNPHESFAYAAGIACFNKTEEYAHRRPEHQECLTPDLIVERGGDSPVRAEITSVTWRRLRCFAVVRGAGADMRADLRLGGAGGASVVATVKPVDPDGAIQPRADGRRARRSVSYLSC